MNSKYVASAIAHNLWHDEPTNRSRYTFTFTSKGRVFLVHSEMFEAHEDKIGPLLEGTEPYWVRMTERPNWTYLVATPPSREQATVLGELLIRIGRSERRRARKAKAKGFHLKEHYRVLWNIQDGKCYFSGELLGDTFESAKYHVDHLIPLSKPWDPGEAVGSDWPVNLALVTSRVNLMKGTLDVNDFLRLVRRDQLFDPVPYKQRRRIDRLRRRAFSGFMSQHLSSGEIEELP